MLKNILLLLLLVPLWVATLWLGLHPDFSQWSLVTVAAVHIAPPAIAWGGWCLIAAYRTRRRARQAEDRAANNEAERQGKLAVARQQHEQELATRHFHCECRWVGMKVKAAKPERLPDLDLPNTRVNVAPAEPDDEDDELGIQAFAGQDHAVGGFAPQLYELLLQLYDDCPAASFLPLVVVPPAHLGLEEVRAGLGSV